MNPLETGAFTGTDRYVVRRCLGGGQLGLVYEGYDRVRKGLVALKTLRSVHPSAIYRLKQEFRALADLTHPNLVTLYELVGDGSDAPTWFIAMELVKGVDFYRYVRGEDAPSPLSSATWASEEIDHIAEHARAHLHLEEPEAGPCPDEARLRAALVHLLAGVATLHGAGLLHRDIKASNALVNSEGRVILVDLGLAYDTERNASELSRIDTVVGTVAYIAPEYAANGTPTTASDMYSCGVLLFQGLTGRLPFGGTMLEMLEAKGRAEAPRASSLVPGVPADLDELCADLLSLDPAKRPSADQALRHLGADPAKLTMQVGARSTASRIEGREAERKVLEEAWTTARLGRAVLCMVRGAAGTGKTALVQHFLRDLRRRHDLTLLRGRCYELESVPFKAFDSLMDGLRRRLRRLPDDEVRTLLPDDAVLLAKLFPVFRTFVDEDTELDVSDPLEVRQRAFAASKELVLALARRKPVLVVLDDVQWGDADSATLLAHWLAGLHRARLLVLCIYRSEEERSSAFLAGLQADPVTARTEVRHLDLQPLPLAIATSVARGLVGEDHPDPTEAAVFVAEESGGNPHLMVELAAQVRAAAGTELQGQTVEELIRTRAEALPDAARRILRLVALAARPLPLRVLTRAAALEDGEEVMQAVSLLRAQHFVRTTQSPLGELVELYQARIAQTFRTGVSPEEESRAHERLALAMETERWEDPEALMNHFLAAGRHERAGDLALAAARAAMDTLAFGKAAGLFSTALELGSWDVAAVDDLRLEHAQALVLAGRGREAARVYLDGADHADPGAAVVLRRRATEQLLSNGYLDEGMARLQDTLRDVGLRAPRSARAALWGVLHQRACLRVRGYDFKDRAEKDLDEAVIQRLDTCWMVALAMTSIDPLLGAWFHVRNLRLSLEAGEPSRVLRAYAMELPVRAQAGAYSWASWSNLLKRSRALATKLGRAHGTALVTLGEGLSAYLEGRFRNAYRLLRQSERTMTESCPGVTFEIALARQYALRALLYTGELKQAQQLHTALLQQAESRGDLLQTANLRGDLCVLLPLAADDPDRARADLALLEEQWTTTGSHFQHLFALRARALLLLYVGRAEHADALLEPGWARLKRTSVARSQLLRLGLESLRARVAVACGTPAHLRRARRIAGRLSKLEHRVAAPQVELVQLGLAARAGDRAGAIAAAERAHKGFDKASMQLHAMVARRASGVLQGGREGDALVASADGWLANQGVQRPDRLAATLAPGVTDID